jgi:GNAT superfamily N-acetyltransferase
MAISPQDLGARRFPRAYDSDVQVAPARTPAEVDQFVKFQWEIYRGDPHWVAPLLMERRDFLNPAKNPFYAHADVELFLARRHGQVVGRIAAIEDRNYNTFHETKIGWFGFFESIDDPDVAQALLQHASDWVKAHGLTSMLGPASFSSNDEWGLLVDGFDQDPSLKMPYNPPYYRDLLEDAGLKKAKDLWAFWLDCSQEPDPKVARIAEKIKQKEGIVVRQVNLKDFHGELAKLKRIYNLAWEKNWGFVPFTDEEFEHQANELRQLVKPDLILFAEVHGEPVAFSLTLPNANQILKPLNGRLFPFGILKALYYSRKVDSARLITLGIVPGYRRRGIDSLLTLETLAAARRLGYRGGEISWTLEDNHLVNRAIKSFGGKRTKVYRIYQAEV